MRDKIIQLLSQIKAGDFLALARGISIVENNVPGYDQILYRLQGTQRSNVVGITGPPGAGKSTLVNALLHAWVKMGKKVAVVAVDPSSPFNYGALLGDRVRMSEFYNNPNVFIRSLASRGALGGLNPRIIEITDLLKHAAFDVILIETVGVGQSEVEIAGLADCTIVALVPEAGDMIQTMKAGIMEIADIFVVNKADREHAESMYRNLRILTHERAGKNEEIPVIKTIATQQQGIEALIGSIEQHLAQQNQGNGKRLQLLTEKSWQLMQAERMKDVDKHDIASALADALKKADFNLYLFVAAYLQHMQKNA